MQKRVLAEEVCVLKIDADLVDRAGMRGRMRFGSFPARSCRESLFKDQIREKGCDDGQRSQERMCGRGWPVHFDLVVCVFVGGA